MDTAPLATTYHQLFPMPEGGGDDWRPIAPDEIQEIKVYARAQGRKLLIPGPFGPHDVPDDRAFAEKFGGGAWEVVAIKHDGKIAKRRSFEVHGPSRFAGAFGEAAPLAAPAPAPAAEGMSSPAVIAAAIGGAVTLLTAWMAHQADRAAAVQAQNAALMQAMFSNKDSGSAGNVELTKVLLEKALTTSTPVPLADQLKGQVELMEALKKAGEKAGGGPDWLRAVEAIGPAALQLLGPLALARLVPGGMPVPPVDAPRIIVPPFSG